MLNVRSSSVGRLERVPECFDENRLGAEALDCDERTSRERDEPPIDSTVPTIAYDITRLFLAPTAAAPRGIDRIDLALACHVFRPAQSALGVLPTPWGIRVFSSDTVRKGLAHLRALWAEDIDPANDERWAMLRQRMLGRPATGATARLSFARKCLRIGAHLRETGFSLGHPVRKHVPAGAIYINVGQIGLAVPFLFDWLSCRQDVTAVLMLHDTIPLDHPDCVEPASRTHHARMIRTAARHGHGLVVTTQHARQTVGDALSDCGAGTMPVLARHLPIAEGFAAPFSAHPDLAGHNYFVVCGTVEPRKNQSMLLRIWQRLSAQLGDAAPHLVIVGSHGYRSDEILAPIASDERLGALVHHVSGLSTPALAQLLRGARAMLVPSLSEGFGLPLLEACALGVQAIASDIPAHREVGGSHPVLLDSSDEGAWLNAILAALGPAEPTLSAPDKALGAEAYCEDFVAFASAVARERNLPNFQEAGSATGRGDRPIGEKVFA